MQALHRTLTTLIAAGHRSRAIFTLELIIWRRICSNMETFFVSFSLEWNKHEQLSEGLFSRLKFRHLYSEHLVYSRR